VRGDHVEPFWPSPSRHFAEHAMSDSIGAVLISDVEIRFLALGTLVVQESVELQERLGVAAERALDALLTRS
jgi:hypothetical protein